MAEFHAGTPNNTTSMIRDSNVYPALCLSGLPRGMAASDSWLQVQSFLKEMEIRVSPALVHCEDERRWCV